MPGLTPERFAARFPRLYHLTLAENADALLAGDLKPAATIAKAAGRADVLAAPRPETIAVGGVLLRDQVPLKEDRLARVLPGVPIGDYLADINARVFFWVRPRDRDGFGGARAYRGRAQTLLVLDTISVLEASEGRVSLSRFNSGAFFPLDRSVREEPVFVPFADWPFPLSRVREVTVEGGVAEVARHLVEVAPAGP